MNMTSRQWVERYARELNKEQGNLSALSSDERKHLRMLLHEYEFELQLAGLQDKLSQGELQL